MTAGGAGLDPDNVGDEFLSDAWQPGSWSPPLSADRLSKHWAFANPIWDFLVKVTPPQ